MTMRAVVLLLLGASAIMVQACSDDGGDDRSDRTGSAAAATGWNGRWRATTENGPVFVTVEEVDGGSVRVTSDSGSSTGRITAPGRAEGADDSTGVGGTFALELRGDRLAMRVKVVREDGSAVDVPEILFDRVVRDTASGARDARLVGHWRHTEARSGPGFSYALDIHLNLSEDGTYASWSTDAEGQNPRTTGTWKTDGGSLFLRPDGEGWHEKGAYSTSGTHLLLTYGPGDKQIFERL